MGERRVFLSASRVRGPEGHHRFCRRTKLVAILRLFAFLFSCVPVLTSLFLVFFPSSKKSKKNSWGVGQAWGYRRRAFAAMARAVGGPGARMHAEVMRREPEGASRNYEWPGFPDGKVAQVPAPLGREGSGTVLLGEEK